LGCTATLIFDFTRWTRNSLYSYFSKYIFKFLNILMYFIPNIEMLKYAFIVTQVCLITIRSGVSNSDFTLDTHIPLISPLGPISPVFSTPISPLSHLSQLSTFTPQSPVKPVSSFDPSKWSK
jgi:hypothetical protein